MTAHTNGRARSLSLLLAAALLVLPVSTRSLPGVLGHLPVGTSEAKAQFFGFGDGFNGLLGGGGASGGGGAMEAVQQSGALVQRCYRGVCRMVSSAPVGGGRGRGDPAAVVGGLVQQCYRGVCRAVRAIPGFAGGGYRGGSTSYGAAQVNAANRVMRSGSGSSSYRPSGYGSSGSGSYGMRGFRRY
jgi:hypothetical protein